MKAVASNKENQDANNLSKLVETVENDREQVDAQKSLEGEEVAKTAETAENNEEEDDVKKSSNDNEVTETVETAENNGEDKDAKKPLEGKEVAKTVQKAENNEEQDDAEKPLEGEVTKTVETAVNGEHKDTKTSSEGSQVTKLVNGENKKDVQTEIPIAKKKTGLHLFFMNISRVYKLDELGSEIARIAVPAALALAADPLASLIDTAFIGHIGSVELAAVGVSISIFNQASKVAIILLLVSQHHLWPKKL